MVTCRVCETEVEKYANGRKCRTCYNAYMAGYMLERYHRRRREAIEALGGRCAQCDSEEELEFDHRERGFKTGEVAKLLSQGEVRYLKELLKCQLLCRPCHIRKTSSESTVGHGGGATGVRNCYCERCKPLKLAYVREWRWKKRASTSIE